MTPFSSSWTGRLLQNNNFSHGNGSFPLLVYFLSLWLKRPYIEIYYMSNRASALHYIRNRNWFYSLRTSGFIPLFLIGFALFILFFSFMLIVFMNCVLCHMLLITLYCSFLIGLWGFSLTLNYITLYHSQADQVKYCLPPRVTIYKGRATKMSHMTFGIFG